MKKNLSESILMNLKEDYEVKMEYNKIMTSLDKLVQELSNLGKQYFTDEFKTKLCKVVSKNDEENEYAFKAFVDCGDGWSSKPLGKLKIGDETVYVYSPMTVSYYGEGGTEMTVLCYSYSFILVNTQPGAPNFNGKPSFDLIDDELKCSDKIEEDTETLKAAVEILSNKNKLISEVKKIYDEATKNICDIADTMSTDKEKDIADKQRKYANAIK